jgi:hypothetical protein
MCISSRAPIRKRQMAVGFVGYFRIMGSQCGTSYHPSGAKNFEVEPIFLKFFCTAVCTYRHALTLDGCVRDSMNLNSKGCLSLSQF